MPEKNTATRHQRGRAPGYKSRLRVLGFGTLGFGLAVFLAVKVPPFIVPKHGEGVQPTQTPTPTPSAAAPNANPAKTAGASQEKTAPPPPPKVPGTFKDHFLSLVDRLVQTEASGASPSHKTLEDMARAAGIATSRAEGSNETQFRALIGQASREMGGNERGADDPHVWAAAACGTVAVMNPGLLKTRAALQDYAEHRYPEAAEGCLQATRAMAGEPVLVIRADLS